MEFVIPKFQKYRSGDICMAQGFEIFIPKIVSQDRYQTA